MAINIDIDVNQSDWLRNTTWDIKPPTLNRLYDVLGITVAPFDVQKQKLGEFLLTPAAEPMPKALLDQIVNVFVKKDLVEKAIELPDHIAEQFPIIPDDDVIVIEIPEYLEKLIGLLKRAIQIFRGQPGFWVTRQGKRLFLKAKGNRLTNFLEDAMGKAEIDVVGRQLGPGILPVSFQNGLKGIFRTGLKGEKELQAYDLSKALKWDDLFTVSAKRSARGERVLLGDGVMSSFAPGKQIKAKIPGSGVAGLFDALRNTPPLGSRRLLKTVSSKDISRSAAFDYLTANKDRHSFNYLIQGKKIKLIDHEDIFPLPPRLALGGPSSGGMFHPTTISSDLFFEAVKRKLPLKSVVGDLNKVNWDKTLRQLGIQPNTSAGVSFFQRLRLLKEGAARGDDFSTLGGTPFFPKASDTIGSVFRFPIEPGDLSL